MDVATLPTPITVRTEPEPRGLNLSFRLLDSFVEPYKTRPVPWGYRDAGGNFLGEVTFMRTYSRLKEVGTKERWWEVCKRVIEGMFSIQKDWCKKSRLPWNDRKAQATAQDAFERLFEMKWTPPGRGLWMMGTSLVNELHNSAALQNCAFVSTADMTKYDPAEPFLFLMEASMLGVGVGFDTKGADKGFVIHKPGGNFETVTVIEDSREGWVSSVKELLEAFLLPHRVHPHFDYSKIRPAGEPIKTFGGTAAGSAPLERLHRHLSKILWTEALAGSTLSSRTIADIGNLIGACVVSGNVRRSAELLIGKIDDQDFLNLKNYEVFPERNVYDEDPDKQGWGWMSNNSVEAHVGMDLKPIIDGIARNGEPGVVWMDLSRQYGRLADPPTNADWRVAGYNPCAEQSLESYEMCTLVETFINRNESLEDYKKTLKVAYLYAKTVTLLPTHWQKTNAIMQRNRRIGTSMSGIADFADHHGLPLLREWMDKGYAEVQRLDRVYSEWLGIRESIKNTTVKPGGTVPLLAGESPGAHWALGGEYYLRAMRLSKDEPLVSAFRKAGYTIEVASEDPANTVVCYFPVHSQAKRSDREVTLFEKAALAATAQRWWSDNSVSVTLSFDPETEAQHLGAVLGMYEGQLKTASFLARSKVGAYPQMPYAPLTREEYESYIGTLKPVDLSGIYDGQGSVEAVGEQYCTTDFCEVKTFVENAPEPELTSVG
jgi:adenosylcobalamin-dependent ribonucleoside-triphosphate reductase